MSKKKIIICFVIIIGISALLIYNGRKSSLGKVKEQLLLTKSIRVKQIPLESSQLVSCPEIKEEETIQEIVKILNDSYIPSGDEWYTLAQSIDYYLEFLDQNKEILLTVKTDSAFPLELKMKDSKYQIDLRNQSKFMKILKKHCEKGS